MAPKIAVVFLSTFVLGLFLHFPKLQANVQVLEEEENPNELTLSATVTPTKKPSSDLYSIHAPADADQAQELDNSKVVLTESPSQKKNILTQLFSPKSSGVNLVDDLMPSADGEYSSRPQTKQALEKAAAAQAEMPTDPAEKLLFLIDGKLASINHAVHDIDSKLQYSLISQLKGVMNKSMKFVARTHNKKGRPFYPRAQWKNHKIDHLIQDLLNAQLSARSAKTEIETLQSNLKQLIGTRTSGDGASINSQLPPLQEGFDRHVKLFEEAYTRFIEIYNTIKNRVTQFTSQIRRAVTAYNRGEGSSDITAAENLARAAALEQFKKLERLAKQFN